MKNKEEQTKMGRQTTICFKLYFFAVDEEWKRNGCLLSLRRTSALAAKDMLIDLGLAQAYEAGGCVLHSPILYFNKR